MKLFSFSHLFWIIVSALFVAGCFNMKHVQKTSLWHLFLRTGLFVLVACNESAWFLYRHLVFEKPVTQNLPLHLCDLSVFIMLVTLVTDNKRLAELSYYMGAVGALLAVCFPAISETGDIRRIAEARYFITHIALIGVGVYFTFGRGYHPELGAIYRSYCFAVLYALLVTPLNLYLETNYFFTLSAPKELAFIHEYPHWMFLSLTALIFLCALGLFHIPFALQRRYSGNTE